MNRTAQIADFGIYTSPALGRMLNSLGLDWPTSVQEAALLRDRLPGLANDADEAVLLLDKELARAAAS